MPRSSLFLCAMLLVGCAVDDRLALTVPVTALALDDATLRPAEGVSLTLTTAQITLADLAGGVAGELLGEWTLDLLGDDVMLGDALCYEGPLATARLSLLPTPALRLAGLALVDGVERPFSLTLSPDQEITGAPLEAELSAASPPGGLRLSVDLNHGLSFINWRTSDTDADGTFTEADGATLNTALFGLTSTPTWRLTLE